MIYLLYVCSPLHLPQHEPESRTTEGRCQTFLKRLPVRSHSTERPTDRQLVVALVYSCRLKLIFTAAAQWVLTSSKAARERKQRREKIVDRCFLPVTIHWLNQKNGSTTSSSSNCWRLYCLLRLFIVLPLQASKMHHNHLLDLMMQQIKK